MDVTPRKNPLGLRVWIRMQGPTGLPLFFDEPRGEEIIWPTHDSPFFNIVDADNTWVATYLNDFVIRVEPILPLKPEILRAESPSITN